MHSPLPAELTVPSPARCDPRRPDYAAILERHAAAMAAGRQMYEDPATGYEVWTALALWRRGTCCDTGCRHCPFVPR